MPKYRAHIEYTDHEGHEQTETVDVVSRSDSAEDLARAAQEAWEGFHQGGEGRLPHNIRWERLDDE